MNKTWLSGITYGFGALAIALLALGTLFAFERPSTIQPSEPIREQMTLPPGAFDLQQQAYDAIGEPLLSLRQEPATMQLPDLRQQITFQGKNNRPDAKQDKLLLNFSLPGSPQPITVAPGEKVYLQYDRKQAGGKWTFSSRNQETSLWFTALPAGDGVDINLQMLNEGGQTINTPDAFSRFHLNEKAQTRNGKTWEIGKWRIDGTLLSRQKARWYGKDLFLEKHGGEEYAQTVGKERIDVTEAEPPYSLYVKEGDLLIWKNDRWEAPAQGIDTAQYPLLQVKKVGDRVMNFELWDVEGRRKMSINLLKSGDVKVPTGLMQQFKFVGAKTRSQFLFEVGKERLTLRPKDWLVFTKTGWTKLNTAQEIDDFVTRKVSGPLFIVDSVVRKGDSQVILGTLFNTSRTEVQQIEVPLQQGRPSKVVEEEKAAQQNGTKSPIKHELRPPQSARPRQITPPTALEDEEEEEETEKLQPPKLREPRMQNGLRGPVEES